jgi:hypothetical protein
MRFPKDGLATYLSEQHPPTLGPFVEDLRDGVTAEDREHRPVGAS